MQPVVSLPADLADQIQVSLPKRSGQVNSLSIMKPGLLFLSRPDGGISRFGQLPLKGFFIGSEKAAVKGFSLFPVSYSQVEKTAGSLLARFVSNRNPAGGSIDCGVETELRSLTEKEDDRFLEAFELSCYRVEVHDKKKTVPIEGDR
jgi:hypothetical protein